MCKATYYAVTSTTNSAKLDSAKNKFCSVNALNEQSKYALETVIAQELELPARESTTLAKNN